LSIWEIGAGAEPSHLCRLTRNRPDGAQNAARIIQDRAARNRIEFFFNLVRSEDALAWWLRPERPKQFRRRNVSFGFCLVENVQALQIVKALNKVNAGLPA
jgi:hypothetical protein